MTSTKATEVRFVLGKGGAAKRKLFVMGINPSTADADADDQTIRKVEQFAQRWHYDGFVMLNLYPLRCTDPSRLPGSHQPAMCERNVQIICDQLGNEKRPLIWAAWGNPIEKREYLFDCLSSIVRQISKRAVVWQKCGSFTKSAHPRHPSRLGYRELLGHFDVESYLRKWQ